MAPSREALIMAGAPGENVRKFHEAVMLLLSTDTKSIKTVYGLIIESLNGALSSRENGVADEFEHGDFVLRLTDSTKNRLRHVVKLQLSFFEVRSLFDESISVRSVVGKAPSVRKPRRTDNSVVSCKSFEPAEGSL